MRKILSAVLVCILLLALTGCSLPNNASLKLRDLEFVILSEERIPVELRNILEEKKASPFQFTYTDEENLYICIGYGEQKTGGYSIAVDALYLTELNVCVETCLLGPETTKEIRNPSPSYPMIVIRTECLEQPVLFE